MAKKNILIVDDNVEILELLSKKLASEGFVIAKISRGGEVVKKAKEFSPDIILMDIVLEDIDGADAVKLLQEDKDTEAIPVLFLSGIVVKEDSGAQPKVKVGERTYPAIGKPFAIKDLLAEIKRIIK